MTCLIGALMMAGIGTSCHQETFTQTEQEWWRLEQHKIDLQNRIKLSEVQVDRSLASEKKIHDIQSQNNNLAAKRDALLARRTALAEEITQCNETLTKALATDDHSPSHRPVGQKFDTLVTPGGQHYDQVTVVHVDDVGIDIRHSTGSARLRYADLSPELRQLFQLTPETAQAALEKERLASAQYDQQVERELAQQRLQQASLTPKQAAVTSPAATSSTNTSPLGAQAHSLNRSAHRYGYYDSFGTYHPYYTSYYYYYYRTPLRTTSRTTTPGSPSLYLPSDSLLIDK